MKNLNNNVYTLEQAKEEVIYLKEQLWATENIKGVTHVQGQTNEETAKQIKFQIESFEISINHFHFVRNLRQE